MARTIRCITAATLLRSCPSPHLNATAAIPPTLKSILAMPPSKTSPKRGQAFKFLKLYQRSSSNDGAKPSLRLQCLAHVAEHCRFLEDLTVYADATTLSMASDPPWLRSLPNKTVPLTFRFEDSPVGNPTDAAAVIQKFSSNVSRIDPPCEGWLEVSELIQLC
jgi:hypothetical protein